MSSRDLPARPSLDHLKRQAKTLQHDFVRGDTAAVARVHAALGPRTQLKLTEAQRVIAREYGCASWSKLRTHVQASRGVAEAVAAFFQAMLAGDVARALAVVDAEPRIAAASLHVAAALGLESEVRRHLGKDGSQVAARAGDPAVEPLFWLCFSPFHGESPARDDGLAGCARALLDAGADPNGRDPEHGFPALYGVTGQRSAPRIARMLLEAGANPTDGESVFHAAEHFYQDALELLLEFGVDLNWTGEWGNTPLYFLLRYWHVADEPRVSHGLRWLLDHGADPNVRCGREQETSLHVAVRTGQHADIVRLLLDRRADVHARRADGRTAWVLARRFGCDDIATLLEQAGAPAEPLAPADLLIAACSHGDDAAARRLSSPDVLAALPPADLWILPDAAFRGRTDVIRACLAAGFPVDTTDEFGATALHHASIRGRAPSVRELLRHGPDLAIRDSQHHSEPLGWACFGADFIKPPGANYEDVVRALLEAGARLEPGEQLPEHPGVRAVIQSFRA